MKYAFTALAGALLISVGLGYLAVVAGVALVYAVTSNDE